MNILKFSIILLLFDVLTIKYLDAIRQQNLTVLQPPLERMLSRKKRYLLMPKGGNLKFTLNLAKRLLAAFPRGFNFVIEAALYYPTPGARIDLIPKRLRKPTTTTPKPKGTKPPIFVCIPGSLICYKAKPAVKPMKVQRIDENITSTQWIEESPQHYGNYQKYQNYGQMYGNGNTQQWTKYAHPEQYQKYKWRPSHQNQQNFQTTTQPTWAKWTTEASQYNQYDQQQQQSWWKNHTKQYSKWTQPRVRQYQEQRRQQRWRRTLASTHGYLPAHEFEKNLHEDPLDSLHTYEPMYFPDLEPHYEWQHYHSHRERRQLFHQFEGLSQILGFDMKSCVVRAICESKRYLLPPGYSMIHDILRVIFTLPTIDGLTDDYSRAMNADFETCDKFLRPKCSINILDWFINSKKEFQ